MTRKRVIIFDRGYSFKKINDPNIDVLMVCLNSNYQKKEIIEGYNVIACFEDSYNSLPVSDIPHNYLEHSWDSDRFLRKYSYKKRLEILGKEISFWCDIFDKYKPDCILNEVVTIEFMEVCYIEARRRNIPYFSPAPSFWNPLTFWLNNPYSTRLSKLFLDTINPLPEDYKKAKEHIQNARESYLKPVYIRNQNTTILHQLYLNIRGILSAYKGHFLNNAPFVYEDYREQSFTALRRTINRIFFKYDKLDFVENTEYILYPLHYEPEACVEYFGFRHNNQISLIGDIAHSLSVNQILVVKEHPQQVGALLTKEFRDIKKRHKNILFVSGEVSSFDIFSHINYLVTLNGTIGFEYWLRKKPVIVLGNVFFSEFPGITLCETIEHLRCTLRNHTFSKATEKEIFEYTAKMFSLMFKMDVSIHAQCDDLITLANQISHLLESNWQNR